MIVYACMCEQMLDCEYIIILMCVGAMQFSLCFFLLFLHKTLAVFQIMMHVFASLIHVHVILHYCNTHSLFNHNLNCSINHLWSHDAHAKQKQQSAVQCTARGFKVWPMLSKAALLKSQALVTITANSLPSSTQPLLQSLRVERTSSNVRVKHCVKSKISLIILSKWNVCLCSFTVIPLTVRADCEAKL